jgi:hypothetical protein
VRNSIITFPSGLEYEEVMEETGSPCVLCEEPAVIFVIPRFEDTEGFRVDFLCANHLEALVDDIKGEI